MIPNASSNRMLLSAVYDENVKNGRNMIINWISGRSRQVAPNTPNMAPLYLKKKSMKIKCSRKKPSMKILLTAPNEGTVELIITLCTKLANADIIPE